MHWAELIIMVLTIAVGIALVTIFKREPAVVIGLLESVLATVMVLDVGVDWQPDMIGRVMGITTVVLSLVVRQNVFAPVDDKGQPRVVTATPSAHLPR